ncbi:hypothetical protein [Rubrivirga litoralis]|uniref:Uncharacterized protein n=1 Tax=Rubrivirga litoralis TaxID=3075598 RepID=A0ABU3BVC9_9BACT|nr:hypothetical protein [Rubrivirga sp. F394]MDT0633251.1 hypothetical protein [Rubrivirga sp. F394]
MIIAFGLGIAGCEQAEEAPSPGGFSNPEVVTPAEVPPSAGEADTAAAPLVLPPAAPPDEQP